MLFFLSSNVTGNCKIGHYSAGDLSCSSDIGDLWAIHSGHRAAYLRVRRPHASTVCPSVLKNGATGLVFHGGGAALFSSSSLLCVTRFQEALYADIVSYRQGPSSTLLFRVASSQA